MLTRRARPLAVASFFASFLSLFAASSCSSGNDAKSSGSCAVDDRPELQCGAPIDAGLGTALGLRGYSCSGAARPDLDGAKYIDGVPEGLLCADRGSLDGGATQSYCCTTYTTPCVYDPRMVCDPGRYGYSCRGADRPESLNAALFCSQGVEQGDVVNYCCGGSKPDPGCLQTNSANCDDNFKGYLCSGSNLPKAEQLDRSESRADYYYMLCSVPDLTSDQQKKYCCFAPAPLPPDASCVQDTVVPGCQPGRFGFACYDVDTPDQDYPPMHCPDPGFRGTSAEGYPATLYCCDYQ